MSMMYSRLIPPLVILSLVDVGRALMTEEPPVVSVFAPFVMPQPLLGRAALPPRPPVPPAPAVPVVPAAPVVPAPPAVPPAPPRPPVPPAPAAPVVPAAP